MFNNKYYYFKLFIKNELLKADDELKLTLKFIMNTTDNSKLYITRNMIYNKIKRLKEYII